MAATTGPNLGLSHSWVLGEDGWNVGMDQNLKTLDASVQLSVKDRDLIAPPAGPTAGDRYIVGAAATGAWFGKSGQIAVYAGSAWAFYPPKTGWLAFCEDEVMILAWTGSAWVDAITGNQTAFSRVASGTFVRDMSLGAGVQTITGVGFGPALIRFEAGPLSGIVTPAMSVGYWNVVSSSAVLNYSAYSPGASGAAWHAIYLQLTAIDCIVASVSAVDDDSFTLQWAVAAGSPFGSFIINWMAMR